MLRSWLTAKFIVSLLPCVATVLLWVRSYWVWDHLEFTSAAAPQRAPVPTGPYEYFVPWHKHSEMQSNMGLITFTRQDHRGACASDAVGFPLGWTFREEPAMWFDLRTHGFDYKVQQSNRFFGLELQVPYWGVLGSTATVPAFWVFRFRKDRRAKAKSVEICASCGYDLRATEFRCPECGTRLPVKPASADLLDESTGPE